MNRMSTKMKERYYIYYIQLNLIVCGDISQTIEI